MVQLRWAEAASTALRDAAAIDLRSDESMLVVDLDGRLVAADETGILGLGPESVLGRTTSELAWRLVRADGQPLPEERNPAVIALTTGLLLQVPVGLRHAGQRPVLRGHGHPTGRSETRALSGPGAATGGAGAGSAAFAGTPAARRRSSG